MIIAAAGAHNLLLVGPPGSGKSLLAARLPGLLPALDDAEALAVAAIRSVTGERAPAARWRTRPFRAPHHSASAAALIGGGSRPRPGEASRSHHGVLFLDELPEFSRQALEMLREPLETGEVHLARAAQQTTYPARFQLIAAMNPCPCGYLGDPETTCRCSLDQVQRYRARLSGPLIDRIDLCVAMSRVRFDVLRAARGADETPAAAASVLRAREIAQRRQGCCNAGLDAARLPAAVQPDDDAMALLDRASQRLRLSARVCHRVLRVARTIADLAA